MSYLMNGCKIELSLSALFKLKCVSSPSCVVTEKIGLVQDLKINANQFRAISLSIP